jgi:hypothetical protein
MYSIFLKIKVIMQLWRTQRTLQIDVDFQMPLHCGMVRKSTPTIYSPHHLEF